MILDFGFEIGDWAELATENNLRVKIIGKITLSSEIWYFVAGQEIILKGKFSVNYESDDIPEDWGIEMVPADELDPILSRHSHLGVVV